jgi:MATE family multidrug resistance protein
MTVLSIASPIALSILCRTAQSLTDLSFLGHLSTDYLAGSSAAFLWMNITSAILYRAFGTSVNTLCAQAFGAGNLRLVGVWLQLSIVLNTVATLPLAVCWWYTGDLLRLIGVQDNIAALANTFARYSICSTWPILIYECISRSAQAGQEQRILHSHCLTFPHHSLSPRCAA